MLKTAPDNRLLCFCGPWACSRHARFGGGRRSRYCQRAGGLAGEHALDEGAGLRGPVEFATVLLRTTIRHINFRSTSHLTRYMELCSTRSGRLKNTPTHMRCCTPPLINAGRLVGALNNASMFQKTVSYSRSQHLPNVRPCQSKWDGTLGLLNRLRLMHRLHKCCYETVRESPRPRASTHLLLLLTKE